MSKLWLSTTAVFLSLTACGTVDNIKDQINAQADDIREDVNEIEEYINGGLKGTGRITNFTREENSGGTLTNASLTVDNIAYDLDAKNRSLIIESGGKVFEIPILSEGQPVPGGVARLVGQEDAGTIFTAITRENGNAAFADYDRSFYRDSSNGFTPLTTGTFSNAVTYSYAYFNSKNELIIVEDTNGSLSFDINNGVYDGQFGDVGVEGFINGTRLVNGTAVLADDSVIIFGESEGDIGQFPSGEIVSTGAFAGDNDSLSFAGGWEMRQ